MRKKNAGYKKHSRNAPHPPRLAGRTPLSTGSKRATGKRFETEVKNYVTKLKAARCTEKDSE
jgi:hypothetical protein